MHLSIPRRALLTALTRAHGVVERKSSMPILANVLLVADGAALRISATDLYLGVIATATGASITDGGSTAVNAQTLFNIVKGLPDGDVSIKRDANYAVEIRCGKVRFRVPGMPGDDFPPLPADDELTWSAVPAATLSQLLGAVKYAASTEDSRPHLCGVLLAGDPTSMRAVATDGHRMSLAIATGTFFVGAALVPSRGVVELARLCDAAGGTVDIAVDGRHIFARREGVTLSAKLADEQFPPYQKVIPASCSRRVVLARTALADAIKRIALVSSGAAGGGVRLVLAAGSLTVASENPDVGDGSEEIAVDFAGEPLTIGASARYMLDALGAIADDDIALECIGDLDPIAIKPATGTDFVGVVMPMRM